MNADDGKYNFGRGRARRKRAWRNLMTNFFIAAAWLAIVCQHMVNIADDAIEKRLI